MKFSIACIKLLSIVSIIEAKTAVNPSGKNSVPIVSKPGQSTTTKSLAATTDLPVTDEVELPKPQPPLFMTANNSVITAQTGSVVRFPCVVKNLGDATVSWIRKKDYHLLTVGHITYTVDDRFRAIHYDHADEWTLQLRYVQLKDAGFYECQISTHPTTSILVNFKVVEAMAQIEEGPDKYVKYGSSLRLRCVVRRSPQQPAYILWYHNNKALNHDPQEQNGYVVHQDLANRTSVLEVARVTPEFIGNYSCAPSDSHPDVAVVHILNGENPAAMQHGEGGALSILENTSLWLLLLCFFLTYYLSNA